MVMDSHERYLTRVRAEVRREREEQERKLAAEGAAKANLSSAQSEMPLDAHGLRMQERAEETRRAAEAEQARIRAEIERRREQFSARQASYRDADKALEAQVSLLHGMFIDAVEEYAGSLAADKAKVYSGIALRAQNYCRMTIGAIARANEAKFYATIAGTKKKNEEPAIKEMTHETVDAGGTPAAGGIDPQLAAVENGQAQNA